MQEKKIIKAFAPATVANVCCGFDVLGFALENIGDDVTIQQIERDEVIISSITGTSQLSKNTDENVVGIIAKQMLKKAGNPYGLNIQLNKGLGIGSGLGSSAASSVAIVFAVNELLGKPFSIKEQIEFAMEGEKFASGTAHADNVAPSLIGGFTLIKSYEPLDVISVPLKAKLFCTIVHPQVELKTSLSRNILKQEISLKATVKQSGNIAGLILGLVQADYDLISRSLNDDIIEPQRGSLIPLFYKAKQAAISAGALGAGISGSGPSLFALSKSAKDAERIKLAFEDVYNGTGISVHAFTSKVATRGAHTLQNPEYVNK
jgi:homoserine kinase